MLPLWSAAGQELEAQLEAVRQAPLTEIEYAVHALRPSLTSQEDIERVLQWTQGVPSNPAVEDIELMVIRSWGEIDGRAAWEYARNNPRTPRPEAETHALAGWAMSDPETAWMTLLQITNRAADARYPMAIVLTAIGERDLPLALGYYEDLVPRRSCLECNAHNLVMIAYQRGRLPVIAQAVDRMMPGPARHALRDTFWRIRGRYQPAQALVDVERLTGSSDFRPAQLSLCAGWGEKAFDDCLAYILERVGPADQSEVILAAIRGWSRGAVAEDVAAVVGKLPSPIDERAMLGVAQTLAVINPQETLAWVLEQPDSPVRVESLDRAMTSWAAIDGDASRIFVEQTQDAKTRGHLLWSYLLTRTRNHELRPADLQLLNEAYSAPWTTTLLQRIATLLVDPSVNAVQFFEMGEFENSVRAHPKLNDEQKAAILRIVRKA